MHEGAQATVHVWMDVTGQFTGVTSVLNVGSRDRLITNSFLKHNIWSKSYFRAHQLLYIKVTLLENSHNILPK